jgi:hypothetical protein
LAIVSANAARKLCARSPTDRERVSDSGALDHAGGVQPRPRPVTNYGRARLANPRAPPHAEPVIAEALACLLVASGPSWELAASMAGYVLCDEADYLQPTLAADRGALHLESRYNYEDRRTVSLFAGWNGSIGGGDGLGLEVTPMLGGTAGRLFGVAPALLFTLTWSPVELHSESEYVIAVEDVTASFFYSWSELSVRVAPWLRAGLAVQRTKLFRTAREVAVGPLIGVSLGIVDAAVYLFDPFDQQRFLVASLAVSL